MKVGDGAGLLNVCFQEAASMTRFIALTLIASMTLLSFVDTADARRCRRRSCCNSCQSACVSNAYSPGAWQDPSMMPPSSGNRNLKTTLLTLVNSSCRKYQTQANAVIP